MSRTKVIISYLPPLLSLEDHEVEQFITRLAGAWVSLSRWMEEEEEEEEEERDQSYVGVFFFHIC